MWFVVSESINTSKGLYFVVSKPEIVYGYPGSAYKSNANTALPTHLF